MQHNREALLAVTTVEDMIATMLNKAILQDVDEIMLLYSEQVVPEDLVEDNKLAFESLPNVS